jgi:hypothetical protein
MLKVKTAIFIFIFTLCFGVFESNAQCSCVPSRKNITPTSEFKSADAVFVGKVIKLQKSERVKQTGSYTETVKFELESAWKTDLPKTVIVVNKIQGCLNGFEENEKWLVYAYKKSDGTFGTLCFCSRTTILSTAEQDLNEFEKNGEKETKVLEETKRVTSTEN